MLRALMRVLVPAMLVTPALAARAHAQAPAASAAAAAAAAAAAPVRVFLDCVADCDQEFLRSEITYVDWVRDRAAADVHVLVTSLGTGGGGREYTLAFLGQQRFAATGDTLRFVAVQNATADETRRALGRTLALGLVRFVARTPVGDRLLVTLGAAAPAGAADSVAPNRATRDPWNFWVFNVGANANVNGEKSNSFRSLNGNASARRTTELWKFSLQARQNYNRSRFSFDDQTSTFIRRSSSLNQLVVRSLGPRLSAGVRSSVGASTFENKRLSYRLTPAVEFDLYPYSEITRRALTLQYSAGVEGFDYLEETIFGRTRETRPLHTLSAALSQNQPWGSVNLSLEGGQYLDDMPKNYASISGGTSVRLFKGLNLNVSGNFSSIHNQLYIPLRGATEEEVLTQQRRLATNYSYFAFTGLSYTFGSVLNNVVNPRFGRGDGGNSSCFCF